jgi:hypothetical protein
MLGRRLGACPQTVDNWLQPKSAPIAYVVALPDADWSPEQAIGLTVEGLIEGTATFPFLDRHVGWVPKDAGS